MSNCQITGSHNCSIQREGYLKANKGELRFPKICDMPPQLYIQQHSTQALNTGKESKAMLSKVCIGGWN